MSRFTSNPSAAAGNVMVTLPLPQLQVRTRYPKSWMIISASPSSGLEMFRSVIWELEWDYWAHFIPKQYCSSLPLTLTKTLLSYLGIGSAVADFFNKDMRQNYNLESTLCLQKWKIRNVVVIAFVDMGKGMFCGDWYLFCLMPVYRAQPTFDSMSPLCVCSAQRNRTGSLLWLVRTTRVHPIPHKAALQVQMKSNSEYS